MEPSSKRPSNSAGRSAERASGRPIALLVAGALSLVGGLALQATDSSQFWLSEQDAQRYLDAAVALHGETTEHGDHDHADDEPAEVAAARADFAEASARVENARQIGRWVPRTLVAVGALLIALGAVAVRPAGG